jgi:hypothetical protein
LVLRTETVKASLNYGWYSCFNSALLGDARVFDPWSLRANAQNAGAFSRAEQVLIGYPTPQTKKAIHKG